jgi:hypothetical protein
VKSGCEPTDKTTLAMKLNSAPPERPNGPC